MQRVGLRAWFLDSVFYQWLPKRWQRLMHMAPSIGAAFSDVLIDDVESRSSGAAQFRVALLKGCIQDLAYADVNRDTADVLLANGCEVVTPRVQSCCGSIHGQNG